MSAWRGHVEKWKDCTACLLSQQRSRICLARGAVPCDVLFVGEAPGASEDALGQPFVGPAGRVLDQIIERAIPTSVSFALTNLVCCFPREAKERGENEPTYKEISACANRLAEFINIARPKQIVCVGSLAAAYVDHRDTVQCVDIVHPAAVLRMPLAQKQMAVQRAIVTVRNAVDSMLWAVQNGCYRGFEEWGLNNANVKQTQRLRGDYDRYADADLPF